MDSASELRDDDVTNSDHGDVPVAGRDVSTEDYQEQTAETRWVVLPDRPMKVEILQTTPFKLLAVLQRYDLGDVLSGGELDPEQVGEELDPEELEVDTSDVDMDDVLNLGKFMRDFIIPKVITPANAYWDDEPDDATEDLFDLSELSDTDMNTLIGAIAGGDGGFRSDESGPESAGHSGGASSP